MIELGMILGSGISAVLFAGEAITFLRKVHHEHWLLEITRPDGSVQVIMCRSCPYREIPARVFLAPPEPDIDAEIIRLKTYLGIDRPESEKV